MEGLLRSVHLNNKAGLSDKAVQFPRVKQVSFEQHGKARNIRSSQSDTWSHLCFKKQGYNIVCGQGEAGAKASPEDRQGLPGGTQFVGGGKIPFLKPEVTPQCFQIQQYWSALK